MPSGFNRLFRYARAEKLDATENFTTEALATCIRYAPTPIIDLLRRRNFLAPGARVSHVDVFTQVHFPMTGFIDLVLNFELGDAFHTLWVEVKVDASEHGQQLTNYLKYIEEHQGITLLTLGTHQLRDDVEHITWREVRRAAVDSDSPHWKDFATFLEELGMADDFDGPLLDEEVASLGRTFSLLRKTAHALQPVCQHANKVWPQSDWPGAHDEIVKALGEQFRKFGRLTVFSRYPRSPAWVVLGIVPDGRATPRGQLEVWVEARPKDLATRTSLDAAYRSHPLPPLWTRPRGGWSVLRAHDPVPSDGNPDAILAWFKARLDEIGAANLFTTIAEMTKAAPTPTGDDPDE
jgi:hypothetical protein